MRTLSLLLLLFPSMSLAASVSGPIEAYLIRVIDGDTIEVSATLWPGLTQHTRVRLLGIDAPEMNGQCERERKLAEKAKARLIGLLGETVVLTQIKHGKYAGRVVAKVEDVAETLIREGLARRYGGRTRAGWCGK